MPGSTIYPVRYLASWGDTEVCKDNRVDTAVTHANGGATIDWRTFHFNDPTAASFSGFFQISIETMFDKLINIILKLYNLYNS